MLLRIHFTMVKISFISGFHSWLLSERKMQQNTTTKYLKFLQKIMNLAVMNGLASARVEFLAKGLKEAKLAVEVRKAQIRMEQEKTPESKKAFRAAWEKMNNYRKAIEGDFVIDLGKLRFRESTGLRWPKK